MLAINQGPVQGVPRSPLYGILNRLQHPHHCDLDNTEQAYKNRLMVRNEQYTYHKGDKRHPYLHFPLVQFWVVCC